MKIGFFDIKDILTRTLFNKEIFNKNFSFVATGIFINFIILFFISRYASVLFFVEPIVQLITAMLILYALLNATNYFASAAGSRSKKTSIANVPGKDFGRFLLVILVYMIILIAAFALLFLSGFISKIPVVGVYIFGTLTPIYFLAGLVLTFFATITGKLINAAFLDNKNQKILDIVKQLYLLPLKSPVKTIYNLMLSFVIIYLPLFTAIILIAGAAFIILFSIWQIMGFSYLLTLSIQGGTNFIAFFLMIAQGLVISASLTLILNTFAGISYSIYKDLK